MFGEHIEPMLELLHRVKDFLGNYWLVKPFSMEPHGDYNRISARRLMGDNPYFDTRNIRSFASLPYKVIYLNRNLDPLVLEPYVILKVCPRCEREELLLFDKFSESLVEEITYLGYETGHTPSFPLVEQFAPSLATTPPPP
jgi:hypothetical protein